MKITHKKITASAAVVNIPSPLDKYYRLGDDAEVEKITGYDGSDYPAESVEGYDVSHIGWAIAKPEFEDALADVGNLDIVEILNEGGRIFLGYAAGDRIYSVTEDDIRMAGIEASTDIKASDDDWSDEDEDDWDSISAFNDKDKVIRGIEDALDVSEDIASIIYMWYDAEDAFGDFDSIEDFADFLRSDIYDMADACDDEGDREKVLTAIEGTIVDAHEDIPLDGPKKPVQAKTWMGKYKALDGSIRKVYFDFDSSDFDETEEYFIDIIPEPFTQANLLGSAPAKGLLEKDGFVPLTGTTNVEAAIDTGLHYWYYGRHGIGPGTIPRGVTVLDTVEEGWKTWMLLDKLLTTSELNEYDLKEEWPPEGSVTHNGDVIACDVMGAEDIKAFDDIDTYHQATERGAYPGSTIGTAFYRGYKIIFDTIEKLWNIWKGSRIVEGGFTNKNEAIEYIDAGLVTTSTDVDVDLDDVEGGTLEDNQKAIEEYLAKQEQLGKQLDDLQEDVKKRSGLFKRKKACASTVEQVGETNDAIEYDVVSSEKVNIFDDDVEDQSEERPVYCDEDVEAMSLSRYGTYKIMPNMAAGCWDILDSDNELVETGFKSESDAKYFIDEELANDIYGSEEVEEEDFMTEAPEQEFSSAETAINGKQGKLPSALKAASIPSGALVLDYGGGTVESEAVAQDYLDQFNATEMLYDPFNQTPEHNREVIKTLRSNGGADVAICSNVLNVIKEENVRLDVLVKIKKLLKNGATCFITVYEGGGSGEGRITQKGKSYQNHRKTADYLEEVQKVFPEAVRKGSVIIAPNSGQGEIAASSDAERYISSIDLDYLEQEITDGCIEYLTGPLGGFLAPGAPRENRWDMYADDVFRVEVENLRDKIRIEVRADLDYDGMDYLSEELNPIVEKYDKDAYFDMVTSGIMEAYIDGDSVYGSTDIKGELDITKVENARDKALDPPELEQEDDVEDVVIDFDFDTIVTVKPDTDWSITDESFFDGIEDYSDVGVDLEKIQENFEDLLEWNIPSRAGNYSIKGSAHLVYTRDYEGVFGLVTNFDFANSMITDFEIKNAGKLDEVESTTKIQAAMTEEELDDAILEGRPFDINDFKKYKLQTAEGSITGEEVEVGDTIIVDEDASEVDLGTVVKVLAINDPGEDWIDYTFKCEVVSNPERNDSNQSLKPGDIINLHFDADEPIGTLVTE